MSVRGLLVRMLLWFGLICVGALVLVGGLALGGPGLVAVGIAGVLAACTAAGLPRDRAVATRWSPLEFSVRAAAGTMAVVLAVSGISVLAGGVVAALAVGSGALVVLVLWIRRARAGRGSRSAAPPAQQPVTTRVDAPVGAIPLLPPVAELSTRALGQEWLRTTAVLAGRLEPAVRRSLVARREDALDELEHRDPAGFARWLAVDSALGSDPAEYVRGGPAAHGPVADTDAA